MKKALHAFFATMSVALVLSVAGASAVMAAEEWDSPSQAGPSIFQEAFWYPSVQLFNWKDFGANRNSETGGLYGAGVSGTVPLAQGYFAKPALEIFGGHVSYEGMAPAGNGGTDYLGLKAVADVGRSFVGPAQTGLAPFGGVGLRYWHRDIKPGNGSLLERWTSVSVRGGLRATYALSKSSKVFAEAGASYPVFTRVSVSGLGENGSFTPSGMISAFAEIGADVAGFRPSVFYEGFGVSDKGALPESQGNTVGFKFGVPF